MMDKYKGLVDAQARAEKSGYFRVPPSDAIRMIVRGDFVKVILDSYGAACERVWMLVKEVTHGGTEELEAHFTCQLANVPVSIAMPSNSHSREWIIEPRHVIEIYK